MLLKIGFVLISSLLCFSIQAKDFGVMGRSYEVIEQSFLKMIEHRLKYINIEEYRRKITNIILDRVENPQEISDIMPAIEDRVFYWDPTYVLKKDIILPCGKILHKAGKKINPLEFMNLDRRLFFIDARQENQIKWLEKQLNSSVESKKRHSMEDRIILIGGSPRGLSKRLNCQKRYQIYFDQLKEMVTRFGIRASPAVAIQEGNKLRIEEVILY